MYTLIYIYIYKCGHSSGASTSCLGAGPSCAVTTSSGGALCGTIAFAGISIALLVRAAGDSFAFVLHAGVGHIVAGLGVGAIGFGAAILAATGLGAALLASATGNPQAGTSS